jgi:hypothetical protein
MERVKRHGTSQDDKLVGFSAAFSVHPEDSFVFFGCEVLIVGSPDFDSPECCESHQADD